MINLVCIEKVYKRTNKKLIRFRKLKDIVELKIDNRIYLISKTELKKFLGGTKE